MKPFLTLLNKYPRGALSICLCVLLAMLFAEGMVVTVVPLAITTAGDSSPASGLAFNAKAYVDRIWPKKVVPAALHESVPLPTLLAAIGRDKPAALRRFGHRVDGTYNMLVRFSGKVSRIDASSPMGAVTVDVAAGSRSIPVKVAIGPVILGTSLRDAMKFISFQAFLNQVQYGDVADDLNNHVTKDVIRSLQLTRIRGRRIEVFGAYTYDDANPRTIAVTPVILRLQK